MQQIKDQVLGQEVSASLVRSVHRNNMSVRLKKRYIYEVLKERKFCKLTLATEKEGGLTRDRERPGMGFSPERRLVNWLMVVRHCSHVRGCGGPGGLLDNC